MSDSEIMPEPAQPAAAPTSGAAADFSATPGSPPHAAARPVSDAPARRRSLWPMLGLIAVLFLAAGEGYLWRLYKALPPDQSGAVAALQAQLAAVQQQQQAAAAPALPPAPPNASAEADLEQKLGALTAQLTTLQTQFAADHGALAALQANAVDLGKLDADIGAAQAEANTDHGTLVALQGNLATLGKLTGQITAFRRLDAARMALDAGQPLGPMPDAPPALARFADAAPPTEAALRLSFPAAARAAKAASVTSDGKRSYWASVTARLEGLITISNGTHVIVGAPAAAVLAQAGQRLDAGDLAGAVSLLGTLSASTQAAMADWLAQARDLLAARGAIVAEAAPAQATQP
jgi:hypothetical protein